MLRAAVEWVFAQGIVEAAHLLAGDGIDTRVVIAKARELTLGLEVGDEAGLGVADAAHLGIFNGGKGVCHAAHAGDAERHQAADIRIVQRHLALFVGVFVVHVVDGVHGIDVSFCEPIAVEIEAVEEAVEIDVFVRPDRHFRRDAGLFYFVHAAIDGEQYELCKVCACTEELHIFADAHGGDAAGNGVIITECGAHNGVALVLDGIGIAGDLRDEALPVFRQVLRPQHGEVRLRGRVEVIERMKHAVRVFGDERAAVLAGAAEGLGDPHGVAAEKLVVFGCAQVARHAEL